MKLLNFIQTPDFRRAAIAACFIALVASPAKAEPYTYSPEHCEFTVTLPSEPSITNKCENPLSEDRCYDDVRFTHTVGLDATIDVKVICNPIDEEIRQTYSDEVIGATLETMTKEKIERIFDKSSHEGDGYKLAGIVGQGTKGVLETMIIAQLWIGDKSAMSVELEMSGHQNEEADIMFKEILKSIYHKESYAKMQAEQDAAPAEESSDTNAP